MLKYIELRYQYFKLNIQFSINENKIFRLIIFGRIYQLM